MHTYHLKIEVARNAGFKREAGGKIEASKVERGTNDEVWNLSDRLSSDECNPMVGFGLSGIS
jgi:hypothetical protein